MKVTKFVTEAGENQRDWDWMRVTKFVTEAGENQRDWDWMRVTLKNQTEQGLSSS